MARDGRNVAYIVGVEVHRARAPHRVENSHATLSCDIELPLGCVRMPMQLPYAARLDGNESGGDIPRDWEVAGIDHPSFASRRFFRRRHRLHLEGVLDGGPHFLSTNCGPVQLEGIRKVCGEDVEFAGRQLRESALGQPKVLRQHRWRSMRSEEHTSELQSLR